MNLVSMSNGKSLHVPYRDSKLTFLLQVKNRALCFPKKGLKFHKLCYKISSSRVIVGVNILPLFFPSSGN